ncbi:GGDEF domain-containing protein [Malonomonas rubra]|uniref:GGDEF domain-containing protein n=1 Tax=Malonomonas rubra TaxID=57040 RepID=UPI0026EDDFE1|nr:GGDEF domain-containing protein [Malonomonas rubra]
MTADSTSSPDEQPTSLPVCPNGKSDCAIIEQLVEISQSLTELSQLVPTDQLTGLANYRTFRKALVHEMERTQRSGQPTTLIMLDIDHFKNVNDSWGHEIGNQALVHIAKLLQRTVRRLDIPCRYGGEEFAIILPNTELSASVLVAERLRQIIAETPLLMGEQLLPLTVSLGIDSYRFGEQTSPEELVQRADHYLYQAKQKGRNQVRHTKLPPVEIVSRGEKKCASQPVRQRRP